MFSRVSKVLMFDVSRSGRLRELLVGTSRLDALPKSCGIAAFYLGAGFIQNPQPECMNAVIRFTKLCGGFVKRCVPSTWRIAPSPDCHDHSKAEIAALAEVWSNSSWKITRAIRAYTSCQTFRPDMYLYVRTLTHIHKSVGAHEDLVFGTPWRFHMHPPVGFTHLRAICLYLCMYRCE